MNEIDECNERIQRWLENPLYQEYQKLKQIMSVGQSTERLIAKEQAYAQSLQQRQQEPMDEVPQPPQQLRQMPQQQRQQQRPMAQAAQQDPFGNPIQRQQAPAPARGRGRPPQQKYQPDNEEQQALAEENALGLDEKAPSSIDGLPEWANE